MSGDLLPGGVVDAGSDRLADAAPAGSRRGVVGPGPELGRDVDDEPLEFVRRRRLIGAQAMISRFELGVGCHVPPHEHENEQFSCVLSGRVRFLLKDGDAPTEVIAEAGEVLHFPAWVTHGAEALEDSVVLDIFAPPSESTGVDAGEK